MDRLNKLDVYYHDQKIGTMALYQNRLAAFAYSDEWLQEGFSISPFSLHLCLKNPISCERFSFHQSFFQSMSVFSFYKAFFSHICSKKQHFSDSKHFHGGGLRFQQMIVQS